MPLMRALWLHYPDDEKARSMGSEYLWGRDILVAPVFQKGATAREVYLPKGNWYDWWMNKKESGGQTISRAVDLSLMPVYVREGAIIPVDPVRQYTDEKMTEPTTLKIYTGANGEYILYVDDGISQNYLKGKGTWTRMTWNEKEKRLSIQPGGAPKGATNAPMVKTFRVELIPGGTVKTINYTGKPVSLSF
jgi:alpha-glucosidase/alpha-D-xyloside xylohydrolase